VHLILRLIKFHEFGNKAHFTLGGKANIQLKSSISIGAKVEISLMRFALGVKAEIEFFFQSAPSY